MKFEERFLARDEKFSGRIFKVVVDDIELPDGKPSKREVVLHQGAVCIAPVTEDNKLIFVRQYRYPMAEVMLELPAGRIEPNEEPRVTATRELAEETGMTIQGECVDMGVDYPTPGYSTEKIYLYAARTGGECQANPDEGEFVEKCIISIDEAEKMAYDGTITDSKTAMLVLRVAKAIREKKL